MLFIATPAAAGRITALDNPCHAGIGLPIVAIGIPVHILWRHEIQRRLER